MPPELESVLHRYIISLQEIYQKNLNAVILYGSYARGDYTMDSDIDIMILVTLSEEEIQKKGHLLSDITFDYNFDYDLNIKPIVKNKAHFEKWLHAYPFYNTIKNEGVELYAA